MKIITTKEPNILMICQDILAAQRSLKKDDELIQLSPNTDILVFYHSKS